MDASKVIRKGHAYLDDILAQNLVLLFLQEKMCFYLIVIPIAIPCKPITVVYAISGTQIAVFTHLYLK